MGFTAVARQLARAAVLCVRAVSLRLRSSSRSTPQHDLLSAVFTQAALVRDPIGLPEIHVDVQLVLGAVVVPVPQHTALFGQSEQPHCTRDARHGEPVQGGAPYAESGPEEASGAATAPPRATAAPARTRPGASDLERLRHVTRQLHVPQVRREHLGQARQIDLLGTQRSAPSPQWVPSIQR
ncbi:hypothetical protein SM007_28320 [Streptomyces avermitilis]|nr:hypothetical protein SM007_28320 [Streptomyces avermitilis]